MAWKNYDKESEVDANGVSRINAAGLINSTLEKLWSESYSAMARGDYLLWNTKLDSIWAILGGDEIEGSTADKDFNNINLKIYELGSLKSKIGGGFTQQSNPNNPNQYQLLLRKALFLRRLQNKQGKGTAYASDDEDDFD
jgi:hypothetical protein